MTNRLDQGPFGIGQDEGWYTIFTTMPFRQHIRNFGTGLVGYTWGENGRALTVPCGKETLEQVVENMAALPCVDCCSPSVMPSNLPFSMYPKQMYFIAPLLVGAPAAQPCALDRSPYRRRA